jgi:hypothetical protein
MTSGETPTLRRLRAVLGELGVPPATVHHDVTLDAFTADAGELALAALILHLEADLPEPFPTDLLDQIDTLGDLLAFADVKRSRARPGGVTAARG